jgi:aspartate/methionine/tyrosine aminotransferase
MIKLSNAAQRLEGQRMFQILAKAQELERTGKEIVHFEMGDPDFQTPENIKNAVYESLQRGETHYTNSSGLLELKVAAADVTEKSRGFKPRLDQLLVTPGANAQIFYAVACVANPGDEIIIPDPGFVSYKSIVNFLGVTPIGVPLLEEREFKINPDDVAKRINKKTKMIIINSPNNPTGSVMNEDDMKEIYGIAKSKNIFLLSDEIYARMIYRDQKTKFASPSKYDFCNERTIVVNGFSKSYAMTGWRLGVVTGPSELIKKMGLLLETTTSCVSPFIQRAGIEALRGDQEPINQMVGEFRKRRDLIVDGLNSLPGIRCLIPKGAFYAFPNIVGTGMNSEQFTELMIQEAGVTSCPGTCFGSYGEDYVRFCYANSLNNIEKGISRMRAALKRKG